MKLFETIAEEMLHIDPSLLRDEMTPKDVPDWDSMNYLLFISELEKEYNISFTMDEVLGFPTLGSVREALRTKGILV